MSTTSFEFIEMQTYVASLEKRSTQMRLDLCQLAASHKHNTGIALGKALLTTTADLIVVLTELDACYIKLDDIMNAPGSNP